MTISGDSSDGAGYIAGEAVHVDVSGPNGMDGVNADATAGEGGSWACQVQLQNSELAAGDDHGDRRDVGRERERRVHT